jgi:hypothetical protein
MPQSKAQLFTSPLTKDLSPPGEEKLNLETDKFLIYLVYLVLPISYLSVIIID